ncbi:MAG: HesA/MoeB/ThiF family protein [Sulfolobales archaeon]|nr:HesA/MoeB/ThiF family protein [Sulfolobales archaeon]MCX8186561.1 HesA/MoeB/ThiF family protein [Sulfolobales archaeon]MDW7970089.1 HesA/MoeB/ThiF family protein [Sulfolobales archaeon]
MELTPSELERYDRQIRLFGVDGQLKLKNSKVLVVGVGGLGCPSSLYLTAAGVGNLILVDSEDVELSNLNRQILHWSDDLGTPKVLSAFKKLRGLNPEVNIEVIKTRADEELLKTLIDEVDLVVDGLDNWDTRFLINRICVELGKPYIHAGIMGLYGQLLVVFPGVTPCLQCLIPKKPPEVRPFPVLGTTPGVMACLQVTEAVKLITGYGQPAFNKLVVYDGYSMSFTELKVSKKPDCPICSKVGTKT